MWYDIAAFPPSPTAPSASARPAAIFSTVPGLLDLNISIIKRLRIQERYNLQFRGEAFNALNHPNFNLPNQNVNAPAGGTITATRTPRLFQLGMRMQF